MPVEFPCPNCGALYAAGASHSCTSATPQRRRFNTSGDGVLGVEFKSSGAVVLGARRCSHCGGAFVHAWDHDCPAVREAKEAIQHELDSIRVGREIVRQCVTCKGGGLVGTESGGMRLCDCVERALDVFRLPGRTNLEEQFPMLSSDPDQTRKAALWDRLTEFARTNPTVSVENAVAHVERLASKEESDRG